MDPVDLLLDRMEESSPFSPLELRKLKNRIAKSSGTPLLRNDLLLRRYRRQIALGLRSPNPHLERSLVLNSVRSRSGERGVSVDPTRLRGSGGKGPATHGKGRADCRAGIWPPPHGGDHLKVSIQKNPAKRDRRCGCSGVLPQARLCAGRHLHGEADLKVVKPLLEKRS